MIAVTAADAVPVVAALLLAVLFMVAAAAKLRSPAATTEDFTSLGLPRPEIWAVAVPVLELTTAAALIVAPGWGGVVAFALLAAFTTNLAAVIRSGRVATCACFGGASTKPVSVRHLLRNVVLLVMAVVAATQDGWLWQ